MSQFQILILVPLVILIFDLSITNFFLSSLLSLVCCLGTIFSISSQKNFLKRNSLYFIATPWQKMMETIFDIPAQLISENINIKSEQYFPIILTLFNFIFFSNLIGLTPYTFTVTSHLIIPFILSFSLFFGVSFMTFETYKMKGLLMFLPATVDFLLSLILTPIEFISYIARSISLGIRLFINLIAGHCLIEIFIQFAWVTLLLKNSFLFFIIVHLLILTFLILLELAVAFIQSYVFTVLSCLYISDSIKNQNWVSFYNQKTDVGFESTKNGVKLTTFLGKGFDLSQELPKKI